MSTQNKFVICPRCHSKFVSEMAIFNELTGESVTFSQCQKCNYPMDGWMINSVYYPKRDEVWTPEWGKLTE